MIYEMTVQVRVSNMEDGQKYYETLLNRQPDFTPHEGFAEWELLPNCWLQVAEGDPAVGTGPLRLGVVDLDAERKRLMDILHVEYFEIYERVEVPVRWATFSDPWGNRLGLFEYKDSESKNEKLQQVVRR
ncbi:VOC family protein [Fictibacillus phosphorivorans]|uniref:Ornithine monooxygenase n=1 Tax=Fictibacillus phosphorivorans TaxID=1221500 RepID=A0A160IL08_9BACL|nr:ornithine monooxygenase [Fictibacillus phosphorivorans]ANC76220.1 ornithine monooxygenase [Fictibacillus phosphorivorans]MQR97207.1 VOC family protein [Fictibacillus phosphorivorans]